MSCSRTSQPPSACTSANACPMVPAPDMATTVMCFALSRQRDLTCWIARVRQVQSHIFSVPVEFLSVKSVTKAQLRESISELSSDANARLKGSIVKERHE